MEERATQDTVIERNIPGSELRSRRRSRPKSSSYVWEGRGEGTYEGHSGAGWVASRWLADPSMSGRHQLLLSGLGAWLAKIWRGSVHDSQGLP